MFTDALPSQSEKKLRYSSKTATLEDKIPHFCADAIDEFRRITRYYAFFHLLFVAIGLGELFCFLAFFSLLTKSSLLAFSLAAIFLTGFAYFVLRFYFQAKKPEQLWQVRETFIQTCQNTVDPTAKGMAISQAIYQLVSALQYQEYNYYSLPKQFETIGPILKKLSAWSYWQDVHKMKEILLFALIGEHVQRVKREPTELEAHATLGNAFIALSKIYLDPRKNDPDLQIPWIPSAYSSFEMQEKFKAASERAIEEFKILDTYAPNDPWVHAQLASIYHDLEMIEEEVKEYENMLRISPQDKEVLYRLGVLYFQQGLNAKALRVYEQLKMNRDPKADDLIYFYDAYFKSES